LTAENESKDSETIQKFLSLDEKDFKDRLNKLSLLVRAFNGESIDPDTVVQYFTDIKQITERSRFPTYPLVGLQVYLRTIAELNPQAKACKVWADHHAHTMISYKGDSRKELVDMKKASSMSPQQVFSLGQGQQETREPKKSLFSRRRKEESEFQE